jgi:hypothetical protein
MLSEATRSAKRSSLRSRSIPTRKKIPNTPTNPPVRKANPPLGKLSKKERSDAAGQCVGKRAGSARARAREERSDDRTPATAPGGWHLNKRKRATKKATLLKLRTENCP